MERKAFIYDFLSQGWTESDDKDFLHEEIERIPINFIVKRQGYMIWNKERGAYEKLKDSFFGLSGEPINYFGNRTSEIKEIPVRYRLIYSENSGIATVFADKAKISFQTARDNNTGEMTLVPHILDFRVESLSIKLNEKRMSPKNNLKIIPFVVAEAALKYLQQEAERIYGKTPHLPLSLKEKDLWGGSSALLAFAQYPFDMNLWLLQEYSVTGRFDEKDNFEKLKAIFKLPSDKPSEEYLKEIYDKNPLSFVVTIILRELGVKKRELVEPFFKLKTFLGDSPADGFRNLHFESFCNHVKEDDFQVSLFEDKEKIRKYIMTHSFPLNGWYTLVFYCHFRLWREGEEALAKHLTEVSLNYNPRFLTSVKLFFEYYLDLPLTLRDKIIDEGLTVDAHNEIVSVINKKKLNWPEFTYTEKEKGYECEIDGYAFRLVYNAETYKAAMREMHIRGMENNADIRMLMYKDGEIIAYFELHGIAMLMYDNGRFYNDFIQTASLRIAFLRWLKWTGLWKNYGPYFEEDYEILREDVLANPLPKDVGLSLYEILNLNEEEDGYYLRLYQAFMQAKPLCFEATPPNTFDENTEKEYLMKLFPYGKRIYDAAFAGNAEAKQVLSLCYFDKYEWNTLFPVNEERAKYWLSL